MVVTDWHPFNLTARQSNGMRFRKDIIGTMVPATTPSPAPTVRFPNQDNNIEFDGA